MSTGISRKFRRALDDGSVKPGELSQTQGGVIALAGVMVAYGGAELIEGYGFIAVFVAGVVLRREETHDKFHNRLHDLSESLEHSLTALLLVALGAALPGLLPFLDWRHATIALALVFVIRPLAAWVSLAGTGLGGRERAVVSFYGVRYIGSVYSWPMPDITWNWWTNRNCGRPSRSPSFFRPWCMA